MKKNRTVTLDIDFNNPPPLTAKQKALLVELDRMTDEDIDLSEMPEVDFGLYRPVKKSATYRFDADVIAWFRSLGKGHQTRMNAVLRREMLAATATKPAAKRRGRIADGLVGQCPEPRRSAPASSARCARRPKISASMA